MRNAKLTNTLISTLSAPWTAPLNILITSPSNLLSRIGSPQNQDDVSQLELATGTYCSASPYQW